MVYSKVVLLLTSSVASSEGSLSREANGISSCIVISSIFSSSVSVFGISISSFESSCCKFISEEKSSSTVSKTSSCAATEKSSISFSSKSIKSLVSSIESKVSMLGSKSSTIGFSRLKSSIFSSESKSKSPELSKLISGESPNPKSGIFSSISFASILLLSAIDTNLNIFLALIAFASFIRPSLDFNNSE